MFLRKFLILKNLFLVVSISLILVACKKAHNKTGILPFYSWNLKKVICWQFGSSEVEFFLKETLEHPVSIERDAEGITVVSRLAEKDLEQILKNSPNSLELNTQLSKIENFFSDGWTSFHYYRGEIHFTESSLSFKIKNLKVNALEGIEIYSVQRKLTPVEAEEIKNKVRLKNSSENSLAIKLSDIWPNLSDSDFTKHCPHSYELVGMFEGTLNSLDEMENKINLAKEEETRREKNLERLRRINKIQDRYRILGEQYDAEHLKKLEELFENAASLGNEVYDSKFIEKMNALDEKYYQLSKQLEADMNKELAQYQCDQILEMEENQ